MKPISPSATKTKSMPSGNTSLRATGLIISSLVVVLSLLILPL